MNREEARQLLEVFRSGGADMNDPRFMEALALLENDPELNKQFDDQRRFDLRVTASIQAAIPVPPDLRNAILAGCKPSRPARWTDWRAPVAVAACVAAIFLVVGTLFAQRTPKFTDFRAQLVHEAWDGGAHLEVESSDPRAIQAWLAGQNVASDFTLPAGLQDVRLVGCRIVEVDGARIPMLCMASGMRHIHLFVVDGVQLAQLPPDNSPDFEKCGSWKTASWRDGDTTYVLTGMKVNAFIEKFRKGGRWTMSG
jgi:hypothetical protein